MCYIFNVFNDYLGYRMHYDYFKLIVSKIKDDENLIKRALEREVKNVSVGRLLVDFPEFQHLIDIEGKLFRNFDEQTSFINFADEELFEEYYDHLSIEMYGKKTWLKILARRNNERGINLADKFEAWQKFDKKSWARVLAPGGNKKILFKKCEESGHLEELNNHAWAKMAKHEANHEFITKYDGWVTLTPANWSKILVDYPHLEQMSKDLYIYHKILKLGT